MSHVDVLKPKSAILQPSASDIIILTTPASSEEYFTKRLDSTTAILGTQGFITGLLPHDTASKVESRDLKTMTLDMKDGTDIVMITKLPESSEKKPKEQNVILVERDGTQAFVDGFIPELTERFGHIERVAHDTLSSYPLKPKTTAISAIELDKPILSTLTDIEMMNIKMMTDRAANVIWLTGGASFMGRDPDFALVSGLARSLALEQPSLRFLTFDIDDWHTNTATTYRNLIQVIEEVQTAAEPDLARRYMSSASFIFP